MKAFLKLLKNDWSKKILFRYTGTYLIAVIIVLALLALIRSEMYKMNYNAIVEDGNKKIDAGLSVFDSTVNMMCTSADMLTELDEFNLLRRWKGAGEAELSYAINETKNALRNLTFMREEYVKSVYVMFNQNEIFVSNFASALSYRDMYPRHFSIRGKGADEWYRQMFLNDSLVHIQPEWIMQKGSYLQNDQNSIACVVHPWKEGGYSAHSAICFELDADALMSSFAMDEVLKNGYIRIEDRQGNLIAERGALSDKGHVVIESKLHEYLKVKVGIPRALIAEEISAVTAILKICIYIGLIGLLFILGVVLMAHNFSAYRMLKISLMYADTTLTNFRRLRSFDYVRDTIASIAASKNEAEQKILLLKNGWNNEMLANACQRGMLTSAEAEDVSALLGEIREKYVIVLLENGNEVSTGSVIWQEEYMRTHLRSAVVSFYPNENTVAFILPAQNDFIKEIGSVLNGLAEVCRSRNLFVNGVGVSGVSSGVDGLNTAYEQARMAMRMHSIDGKYDYAVFETSLGNREVCIGIDVLSKLSDLVVMGEEEEIRHIFAEIMASGGEESSAMRYMYVFSAVRMALLNAGRMIMREEDMRLPDFRADEDARGAMEKCLNCALDLCSRAKEKRRSNNVVLRQKITDYIMENYRDSNLTGEQIAEKFSISKTYVLQFMRMQFGKTLNEYIDDVRLDAVEKLLTMPEYTIDKIMEETGYISQNTLYRAFKKRHGVTPGKWREMMS